MKNPKFDKYSLADLENLMNLNPEQSEILKEINTRHFLRESAATEMLKQIRRKIHQLDAFLRKRLVLIDSKNKVLEQIRTCLALILDNKDISRFEEIFEKK